MKTQKFNSAKALTKIILVTVLLIVTGCNSRKENSSGEKKPSSASQKDIKPPSMDIHTATVMGNLDAIEQHIKAGSDLDKKDDYGSTALITAAVFGKTEVALALIEGGADVNLQNNDGSTPLYCAAFFCRTEIVQALLVKGADKNIMNNFGSTALESVAGPFKDVKGIYDLFSKELGPLGLKLDYEQIEKIRPVIAEMLR